MYKKVELNDNEVLQNGIIIGQVIKKIDEGFVVRLNGKIALRLAFYGTVDRKGNFYQFCRNNNCGSHCKSSEKPLEWRKTILMAQLLLKEKMVRYCLLNMAH